MYNTVMVQINRNHPLYEYCSNVCHAANNLYNATLFRLRQVMTGVQKNVDCLKNNEAEVLNEIADFVSNRPSYKMPTEDKWALSYSFLVALMYYTHNKDFVCDDLPIHTAEYAIKQAVKDMKSYCKSCKAYQKKKDIFTGAPKLPKYKESGGQCTSMFSNQECVVKTCAGDTFVKLPHTKEVCNIKQTDGRLKFATLKPFFDVYFFSFVFEVPDKYTPVKEAEEKDILFAQPERCIAIDFGVDNLAAISNNFNQPGLLIKGGIAKSKNQLFNKINAQMQSLRDRGVYLDLYQKNWVYRKNFMRDIMHKYANYILVYCLDHKVDTIVLGTTKGWKQKSNISKQNNQTFVGIPFDLLKQYIRYKAIQYGINVLFQEESYTSKASFKYKDDIPVYEELSNEEYDALKFSGRRIKRGLYRNKDGSIINADLNAAANIGRKALPDLFTRVNLERPDILTNIFNM